MTQTETVERFFSMEKKLRELSGELIVKHMTAEEIKKAIEKDIKDFSDFAYNNSDVIYNAIKENLIEQLKNDAIKPVDALFIYLTVTNFTSINPSNSTVLSHSVAKINEQNLANSAKTCKDEQNHSTKYTLEQAARIFLDALSDTPYNNKPVTDAQVITKELLKFLSDAHSYNPNAINEQNPAWTEEDEVMIKT